MKRIPKDALSNFPVAKQGPQLFTDLHGFYDEENDLLGIMAMCDYDKDYNFVVLAREDKTLPFHAIDMKTSIENKDVADAELLERLSEWRNKERSEIEAALR